MASTIDPNGDSVQYQFDWGDGLSEWSETLPSGSPAVRMAHAWSVRGTYDVRVRAKDVQGDSSGWSEAHAVEVIGYPNRVIATIPVGKWPLGVAALPDGKHVYLTTTAYTDTIYEISTEDNTIEARIGVDSSYPNIYCLERLAVLPGGDLVYIAGYLGTVFVLRTSDNAIIDTLLVGPTQEHIAAEPSGRYVYITSLDLDRINVIRVSDNTVAYSLQCGPNPMGLAATPDGKHVYATAHSMDRLLKIDVPATGEALIVGILRPSCVTASPDSNYVYVTGDSGISVIRTSDDSVEAIPHTAGTGETAALPNGRYLYATHAGDSVDSVLVYRTRDFKVVARIPVGRDAQGICALPDGSRVYVANYEGASVTVIGY